jgi:mannose-6-phosphate isomerase-like protein (cupin superfamily)
MDKVYHVLEGTGRFLLDGRELPMKAGDLLVAPGGVLHGVRNTGNARLLVLVVLAPPRQTAASGHLVSSSLPSAPQARVWV